MEVSLSTEPIAAGESRMMRVEGSEPIVVQIKCFVEKPPPPGFKPCPECGSFTLKSGEAHFIKAPDRTFARGGGTLRVFVEDGAGNKEEIRLTVVNWGMPGTGGGLKAPPVQTPAGGQGMLMH